MPANQTQREETIYKEFNFSNDGNQGTYTLRIDARNVVGGVFRKKTFNSYWVLAEEDFERVPIVGDGIKTFEINSKLSANRPNEQIGVMIQSNTSSSSININGASLTTTQ